MGRVGGEEEDGGGQEGRSEHGCSVRLVLLRSEGLWVTQPSRLVHGDLSVSTVGGRLKSKRVLEITYSNESSNPAIS